MAGRVRVAHHRSHNSFIWATVVVSFAVLVLATVLQTVYSAPNTALISKPVDSVLFELAKQASTALLAAGTVGFAISVVMSKLSESEETRVKILQREGLEDIFSNYNDPIYQSMILDLITRCQSEIVFIGLGHGLLMNHTNLLDEMHAVLQKRNVSVTVLFGDAGLEGVRSRVAEEAAAHRVQNLGYDVTWVTRFPEEIRAHLSNNLSSAAKSRLKIGFLKFTPCMHYVRVDNLIFVSSYGAPAQRGSASPVLHFRMTEGARYGNFLATFERDAISDYTPG